MCGIVGAVAERDVVAILGEGLKRLEYRGYDSAGMAVSQSGQKQISRLRTPGKVGELLNLIQQQTLHGHTGIAHTRWATHGAPLEHNAHPHTSHDSVALVHNGIIDNFEDLARRLQEEGYQLSSQTDSELIAHVVHRFLTQGQDLLTSIKSTCQELQGAYAIAVMAAEYPDRIVAVRRGSPLVIGVGIGENFLASDMYALLPVVQRFIILEEGDLVDMQRDSLTIYDAKGQQVERPIIEAQAQTDSVERGEHRHYMSKEIFEQPQAIRQTLAGRVQGQQVKVPTLSEQDHQLLAQVQRIHIVACGTSYHAGMIAKYWLEQLAELPVVVEIASEFRYRDVVIEDNTLFVTISQSGETADTLAGLSKAKSLNYLSSLTICNVPHSSLVRESAMAIMTNAGIEIGVASTKAFTTQLTALLVLTLLLAGQRQRHADAVAKICQQLQHLPDLVEQVLELDKPIEQLAARFANKDHSLFLGRGVHYPVALEGALKLKEISYIHAEAYPAGELKHGPLALVDEQMPVIAVAPNDQLLEKLKANLQEVKARGGELIVFADQHANITSDAGITVIDMPPIPESLSAIVYTIPLQLLSYHVAVLKGTDVDQPRNLAKSVTVE